jgi:hypothetical protein
MALALEIHYYHNDHAIAFLSKDKLTLVESREVLWTTVIVFYKCTFLKQIPLSNPDYFSCLKKDNLP